MRLIKFIFLLISLSSFSQTWQAIPNIDPNLNGQRFDDVFFLDENIGWAANGYYASVYKTMDGGLFWTEQLNQAMLGGDFYFRNIEFLNSDIGFLGTLNGTFLKTIDGGDTWTIVTNITPNPVAICGLDTVGASTIYGCGAYFSPAHIIKSNDRGATWEFIDMSSYADALVEIYFLDENIGFASGKNAGGATILKTIDGGSTWTEIYNSNIIGEYVWKLQVLENSPNVIFGAVESVSPILGKLIKSIDSGTTWSSFDAPETGIQAVGFISENHGWMGGHTTGFHETLDGGVSWTDLNVGSNLNRIVILNSTLAYASGAGIYKFTEESLSTESFIEAERESLNIHILNNPVTTNLEFSINFKKADNLLIELYDSSGRFIKRLTREIIDTSNYEKKYSFPIEDLASGIYIVDFHNNTGRESRKFIKQ